MPHWWHIAMGPRPALPADEIRRRRREAIIIGATAVVFLVFGLFETRLPRFSNSQSLSGNIIFFLLINLNLILLILLIFLVTRNLVKLVFERRRGILWSRLRTRLVLAFVGLTLFPSALLFFVAEGFLSAAIESWFNVRVESSLEGSLDVAQSYYQFAANNALHFAREIAGQVGQQGLWPGGGATELQRFVERKRQELNLGGIEVVAANQARLARANSSELASGVPPESTSVIAELLRGEEIARTRPLGQGDVVRAGAPVRDAAGAVIGAVTVDYVVPRNVSKKAGDIARSYEEYRQLGGMKQPIKNGYILTLALITLVVIFSATWFGFQQAKSITIPLQRLAEGTREVAQGNWSYRIEAGGDEETAVLVDSFNQMTADLQQINSQLVERRKYVENILANITAGVVSLSQNGTLTMLNRAAERMLGLHLAQVRGKQWTEIFQDPNLRKVGEVIADALASSREVERQVKMTGGDHILTALISATPLTDDAGVPRGLMLFFEDVTHLLRVQRMEAWREVARRLAHEIKNPLTPIQLSAQRLRKRYAGEFAKKDAMLFDECTRTIIGQVEELKRLVNEFSNFARLPSAELAPHDLNAVVEDALVLFRQGHPHIAFEFRPQADLPEVELDREAIKRALINMLDNAVAACQGTPDGTGRIEIITSHVAARGVVRLDVADNGSGMSREVKLRLFEPYFSTKKEGTGLGLAIVSAIVADHQAYIRVQDNQPRGSRFIIDFPLRPKSAGRVAARA